MNRLLYTILFLLAFPIVLFCQNVVYSDFDQEDSRDINFEIIGKMNGNVLVYKNIKWRHKISILGDDMQIKETIKLDFMPDKTFNVDFVTYHDHFYIIYQFQKKNTLHCMSVKMDANAKIMADPIELDTTQIPVLADNKIYTTIVSENHQKIMIYKIPKRNEKYVIATYLFDSSLNLLNKSRNSISIDDHRDNYDNFSVDNEGNFVFTKDSKIGNRDNSSNLDLYIKEPNQDTFDIHTIEMNNNYIDEVKLKVDNLNKRYVLNSFFYKKSRGSIDGLFTCIWDKKMAKPFNQGFLILGDSVRDEAKTSGQLKFALDDFFIRQVFAKKDGGVLLTAEDYSMQAGRSNYNNWNRWDYLNNLYFNPYYYSPYSYSYNPYSSFYRPMNSFGNQSTRYYYANILILSLNKLGKLEWSQVIHKDQSDDDNDNYLSFSTINSGVQIHFLFNDDKNKNQIIANQSISPAGILTRNPTLKSQERGYQFMPKLSKQVGANQIIIPCVYRNYICFAKVNLQ
ncbi:MAG: hypothetical protein WCG67_05790 [Ferruginibacter sp.]